MAGVAISACFLFTLFIAKLLRLTHGPIFTLTSFEFIVERRIQLIPLELLVVH